MLSSFLCPVVSRSLDRWLLKLQKKGLTDDLARFPCHSTDKISLLVNAMECCQVSCAIWFLIGQMALRLRKKGLTDEIASFPFTLQIAISETIE